MEIEFEFLNQLSTCLLKGCIKEVFSNEFKLVLKSFLCLRDIFMSPVLSLVSLGEDVLLEGHHGDHLTLELLETVFQVLVLFRQAFVDLFLVSRNHELKIRIRGDLVKPEFRVGPCWCY